MPKRRKIRLSHSDQRAILTDTLPFEVPPTFSNRGFYAFLVANLVEFKQDELWWKNGGDAVSSTMRFLFGICKSTKPDETDVTYMGKKIYEDLHVKLDDIKTDTIPFEYRISHRSDGRTLCVTHPRNQVWMAGFYAKFRSLIVYYTSLSPYSIRYPVAVAKLVYFDDKLHKLKLDKSSRDIEVFDREYEEVGSYFVYEKYQNIHRFFESYEYHRCEKKYDSMVQIDVSKCFDSIYTHSLSWAILGKDQTKQTRRHLSLSKSTFGGKFDLMMQRLNNNETNGIIIGPEFSRIFAEIILQSVDVKIEQQLRDGLEENVKLKHKVDYEAFRYVDDYFIFFNDPIKKETLIRAVQEVLKEVKLSVNMAKVKSYKRPIITELTIAKQGISLLLEKEIRPKCKEIDDVLSSSGKRLRFRCKLHSKRIIIGYKQIVLETKVEYNSVLNYTFSILERKVDTVIDLYNKLKTTDDKIRNQKRIVQSIESIFHFMFFVYFASPSVGISVRVCRMISTSVDFLTINNFLYDLKHFLYKSIHDNIRLILSKTTMNKHREVESLYLLISLSSLGKEYWLSEKLIATHFSIKVNESDQYERRGYLGYFSITVLLFYMKNKKRYNKLRDFIEHHTIAKIRSVKFQCHSDAEVSMLFLDMIVCPYITSKTKIQLAEVFDLSPPELRDIVSVNDYWFTVWDEKFDLAKALDAKRRREVY